MTDRVNRINGNWLFPSPETIVDLLEFGYLCVLCDSVVSRYNRSKSTAGIRVIDFMIPPLPQRCKAPALSFQSHNCPWPNVLIASPLRRWSEMARFGRVLGFFRRHETEKLSPQSA